ncbi:hypothetical protein W02_09270 [Nitrospira sp. KM1]|uniref:hypothetical protein n=1 Tax=Nitrospira sp. KM1 TaxID=1936990 RepID=UPI0013A70DE5|nr:hypothetical protein [Nitrospira sp. KM1]BCA53787.1 hypothetical protein W02_09270 [Nitrospira sp. KM1]
MESESRSSWPLTLSFVEVLLLLVFAVMMVYVADNVESKGPEPAEGGFEPKSQSAAVPPGFDMATAKNSADNKNEEKNSALEKRVNDMAVLVNELKLMVGAKASTKESFQEAIDNLKRGYVLCQKESNTLIEASMLNGVESVQVIGEIPRDLEVSLTKGNETSDLDEIVSFTQEVYQYEKAHNCRFNYRLKYATDNDYRKARETFEKYFYPEKMIRIGTG